MRGAESEPNRIAQLAVSQRATCGYPSVPPITPRKGRKPPAFALRDAQIFGYGFPCPALDGFRFA